MASVVSEPFDVVGLDAAGSSSGTAASGEAPPMDVGVGAVASEPDRKKSVSGDGRAGPSNAAVPSDLKASYAEIDESYKEAAEYAMWAHVSAKLSATPTAAHIAAATTAAPIAAHLKAAFAEIDESYDEAAEYAMWGHVSAAPTSAPTAAPTSAPTAAPTEVHPR